ncbi:hypothetical protein [Kitasatospora sp. NPDC086791]|uniref:hypothetical protein n=1 Tax=Kitasatospora sp. NPDC086791 TaxID=3155178 RepID=UPI0034330701
MTTTTPQSASPPENSPIDKLKNGLGFLLAAFVGALNLLGLRNSEVTAVLRNDPLEATLVGGLMLLALTAAVVAIFLPNSKTMPPYFVPAVFAACIALTPVVICTITIPLQSTGDACFWAIFSAVALVVLTVLLGFQWCGWTVAFAWIAARTRRQRPAPARPGVRAGITSILLICSVILTAIATFAAARLEVRSQVSAANPSISAVMKGNGSTEDLSLTIAASRIADGDKVGLIVQAVPRTYPLVQTCSDAHYWRLDDCLSKAVCNARDNNPCDVIVSSVLQPDSTGEINTTVDAPVSTSAYQFVDVRAQICDIDWTVMPENQTVSPRTCKFDKNKTTLAFLRIPPP